MLRRLAAFSLFGALFASAGCDAPPAAHAAAPEVLDTGAPAASTPAPEATTAPQASSSAAPQPSASAAPVASVPADWTAYSHARLGVSFSYPKATFTLTETAKTITLVSTLARDELGEDPHPKKHVWSMWVTTSAADVKNTIKKDSQFHFDAAFPKGVFDPKNQLVTQTTVSGLDGYRLQHGVEGYNSDELFLARSPSSTLVVRFDTIGDVMGPDPAEAEQQRIFGLIESSMKITASPK